MNDKPASTFDRRDALKLGAAAGLGLAQSIQAASNDKPLRIGFVGTGGRGTG
ncbi:MAG: gfo/Idh/MocA family oxidoreductase, partial [bacterium]|nr:gfo/Idh/MocA family oxidoreductase [bacterium]